MNIVDLQLACDSSSIPAHDQFQFWVDSVLVDKSNDSEIVIRIVDEDEMTDFNAQYRDKAKPTNILSFPFDAPEQVDTHLLGDLLVCAPVIERESIEQKKPLDEHWAHMIIHGVLHLLGYDHIDPYDAEEMETLEIQILKKINIANPYEENE